MASRGINKVILLGNLGADPDIRHTADGRAIANLRLATGEAWKDQQGHLQERTEWHRVVMYGRTAEIARDYLRKGSKLYLEGRIQTRKWQDKDGRDQYTTEIIAQEFQMLDRKDDGTAPAPSPNPTRRATPHSPPVNGPGPADFDDDIPF